MLVKRGVAILYDVELCYRAGLKVALSIRANMNNEIVYVESGKYPLHCHVKKVQLKFWLYVKKYISDFPDAALSKARLFQS